MRSIRYRFAILLLSFADGSARAQDIVPGLYRAAEGPDLASQLQIEENGHFRYFLSYGALDEQAEGLWKRTAGGIALTTDPRPRPPLFSVAAAEPGGEAPFTLQVVWPDGSGIAGIDLRIGFANGETAQAYTQQDGWTMDQDPRGAPIWIELYDAIHGFASPRFTLAPGARTVRVLYTPNDLGIADFNEAPVTLEQGRLLLRRGDGAIHYVKDDR